MDPIKADQTIEPIKKNDKSKQLSLFVFHPTTVLVMLILDWGGLLIEIPATIGFFTLIFTAIIIFIITASISYYLQCKLTSEDHETSKRKAILAGIICALPYPMMSSAIGAMILALSGFDGLYKKGLPGILQMFEKRN